MFHSKTCGSDHSALWKFSWTWQGDVTDSVVEAELILQLQKTDVKLKRGSCVALMWNDALNINMLLCALFNLCLDITSRYVVEPWTARAAVSGSQHPPRVQD